MGCLDAISPFVVAAKILHQERVEVQLRHRSTLLTA